MAYKVAKSMLRIRPYGCKTLYVQPPEGGEVAQHGYFPLTSPFHLVEGYFLLCFTLGLLVPVCCLDYLDRATQILARYLT